MEGEPPDLVITDIFMPELEGMELLRRMRLDAVKTHVMAVSGGGFYADFGVLDWAERMGADATLAKPFTPEEFFSAVETVIPVH